MAITVLDTLIQVATSASVVAVVGVVFKDSISRFVTKSVEHRFDRKLENFKTTLRESETELEQIRSYLVSSRREREASVQVKRLEAAEAMLRARNLLAQFSLLIQYLNILNLDVMLKDDADPRLQEFMRVLTDPFKIEAKVAAFGAVDKSIFQLYLSEQALNVFSAYEATIMQATLVAQLLRSNFKGRTDALKEGALASKIINLIPDSKPGFDREGDRHAFRHAAYLHDEILRVLRLEVSGEVDHKRDAESAGLVALASRQAHANVRATLAQIGIPEDALIASK